MPSISGVLETALYVEDLDRSERFYSELFEIRKILGDDRIRALRLPGQQVLLLFRKGASTQNTETEYGVIPSHDGDGHLHLAFRIEKEQEAAWRQRLVGFGIPLESGIHPRDGVSLYFRDPDGHCIELASPEVWPDHGA
ncbi:glyoxalase [bacterium]|nr:MAG: glyoxalase [bacterium]